MRLRALVVPMALAAVLCVTAASAQEAPRMGGVLKVASVGEPPTLDIPMSTAVIVYEIMWHVPRDARTPSASSRSASPARSQAGARC